MGKPNFPEAFHGTVAYLEDPQRKWKGVPMYTGTADKFKTWVYLGVRRHEDSDIGESDEEINTR